MNVNSRKNKGLIFKFIELRELIVARDNIKSEMNEINKEMENIVFGASKFYNDLYKVKDYIKSCKETRIKKEKLKEVLISYLNSRLNQGNEIYKNGILGKIFSEFMTPYSFSIDYREESFYHEQSKINKTVSVYRILKNIENNISYKVNSYCYEIMKTIPSSFFNIPIYNEDKEKLAFIIFKNENPNFDINKHYNDEIYNAIEEIKEDYNSYKKYYSNEYQEYCEREEELKNKLESQFILFQNTFNKKVIGEECYDKLSYIRTVKCEFLEETTKMYKDLTDNIEKTFIKFIPKKYVFDEKFRNFAIENLYYEKCNSIGEVLNAYENLEYKHEMYDKFDIVLSGLNSIELNQLHEIMELQSVTEGIEKSNENLLLVGYEIKDMKHVLTEEISDMKYSIQASLDSIRNDNDRSAEELIEANYKVLDGQRELLESNNNINRRIESSNNLAKNYIDSLSSIDAGTREVAKNIQDVKEFTNRYRSAKAFEGKTYY